jgi:hypothetical protein
VLCKTTIVISTLQSACFYELLAKRLLLSAPCKAPIVISTLQSAYCYQDIAKRLLLSMAVKVD